MGFFAFRLRRGISSVAYGIKANVNGAHRYVRSGALCWVLQTNPGAGGERLFVKGLSRGGRMVRTWIRRDKLENFRTGWVPDDDEAALREAQPEAQGMVDQLKGGDPHGEGDQENRSDPQGRDRAKEVERGE